MEQCSVAELIKHYRLAEGDCNRPVSDSHLECISDSHCEHWRKLPAHLDLEAIVVKDIDRSQGDEGTKRLDFFRKWKEIKGSGATYKRLITALLKIDCREDAERVCKMLKGSGRPSASGASAQPPQPQNATGTATNV